MTAATIGTVGVLASVGIVASASLPSAAAKAGTTSVALPMSTYSHMVIDPVHRHIFFSGGSSSTSILVTDYSGNTVATIPNQTGATGLALSSDGGTVYAALSGANAVSAISTSTLAETARYATGTGNPPYSLAYTEGKIWFGYDGAAGGGIGSIDPSASPATVALDVTGDSWYQAPGLAANPNGELVAGQEAGISPASLASYDVSGGTVKVLHSEMNMYASVMSNLQDFAITPDGKDVVTAAGSPYEHQVFKVADLSADGQYDSTNYPDSVAIGADGTVFAGSDNYYGTSVFVFAPGNSHSVATYTPDPNSDLAPAGLAVTPDDSELFAVSNVYGNNPTLDIISNPALVSSTLSITGPATARHGDTVTFTGTLGGPSAYAGGQKLTVTRVDPADPNGVPLPDVTTAADGSFSFSDTAPKTVGADTSTVTYQVSYAGDAHLTVSNASASVTVDNTGS